jgi:hypothetical protein
MAPTLGSAKNTDSSGLPRVGQHRPFIAIELDDDDDDDDDDLLSFVAFKKSK